MKAVLVAKPGGADQLYIGEVSRPEPKADEILVKVKATALNRADILQREGKYPPPPGSSPILGLEMAGVVEQVGEECLHLWKPGDRVFGLLPGGGYAEYAVIPGEMAMPVPKGFTFEEAAAIPEAFLTAYQCLVWIGGLKKGKSVLIHAGASGVGTAAIQLAKAMGARVFVTVGSEEKRAACLGLGADGAFNYKEGPFAEKVAAAAGGGVDVVLDSIGASYWTQNLEVLNTDGRWVLISTLGGSRVEQVSLARLLAKRITLTGTTLRSRPREYKTRLNREFASFALPLLEQGTLRPVIDRVFPWEEVREAHRYMEQNKNIGKVVMRLS
jgi:putative PIG3 family NAD(P)H quinone oxidoreductase